MTQFTDQYKAIHQAVYEIHEKAQELDHRGFHAEAAYLIARSDRILKVQNPGIEIKDLD